MNFILKYITLITFVYLLFASLLYFYFFDLGKEYQPSTYYEKFKGWWGNSNEFILAKSPMLSKCVITPNIYSEKEIARIYNYIDYKPCKLFTNDSILIKDNQVTVKCLNKRLNPNYLIDKSEIEIYGGSKKEKTSWRSTLNSLKEKQFLFIKCSYSAVYAYVFNRFNQKFSDSANEIRMKLGNNEKPMSVLLVILDSVSKYSFQRNLPKTNDFLKKLKKNKEFKGDFSVIDFDKSAIPLAYTKNNIAPIIYGKTVEEIEEVVGSDYQLLEKNKDIY